MSTPNQTDASNKPAQPLAGHPDPVRYDVAAGLARHRELVASGAALPDWAKERSGLAHATLRGVVLTGLAGLMLGAGFLVFPRPDAPSSKRAPTALQQAEAARPISVTPVLPPAAETPAPALKPPATHVSPAASPRRDTTPPARPKTALSKALSPSAPAKLAAPKLVPAPAPKLAAPKLVPAPAQKLAPVVLAAAPTAAPSQETSGPPAAALPAEPSGGEIHAAKAPVPRPQIDAERPEVLTEMEQLKLAERLLAREPQRTLSIVRAGLEQFRPGYFTQERRYLEVMALLALGSADEARMRGRVFVRDYPEGPYRRKVERALSEPAPSPQLKP